MSMLSQDFCRRSRPEPITFPRRSGGSLRSARRFTPSVISAAWAPGGSIGGWTFGLSGMFVTLFAMIIATIPPPDIGDSLLFRLKVIGGALGFVLIGGLIYGCARLKKKHTEISN